MTLAVEIPFKSYLTDGVTASFPLGFTLSDVANATAVLISAAAVVSSPGFSVSGGNAVLSVVPAAGGVLNLARVTPISQLANFVAGGDFPSQGADLAFDRIVRIIQELAYSVSSLQQQVSALSTLVTSIGSGGVAMVTAYEALPANCWVNLFDDSGTIKMRKAIASDPAKLADGFVALAIAAGAIGIFSDTGVNVVPVTATGDVWLSDTVAGALTTVQPTTVGNYAQSLGRAMKGIGVRFRPDRGTQL